MLGEFAPGSRSEGASNDLPNSGLVLPLRIAAGTLDEGGVVHHCLVATSYLISGLTHRASSPLGALLTNLSMLREDLTELMGPLSASKAGESPEGAPLQVSLERALEDVEGALEIAERLRADLAIAKGFAAIPRPFETSDLKAVLSQWTKTTASATLGAGALRVLAPELPGAAAESDPDEACLVSGSRAALNHLLTTALLLITSTHGSVRSEAQVSILSLWSEARVEVTLSTACRDGSFMTKDWSDKASALGRVALAQVGQNASLELTQLDGILAAKLVFEPRLTQPDREGSWA